MSETTHLVHFAPNFIKIFIHQYNMVARMKEEKKKKTTII